MRDKPIKILAVLVLYRCRLDQSVTFKSLCEALNGSVDSSSLDIRTLVYDNSESPGAPTSLPAGFKYAHNPDNGGLAAAYNAALRSAEAAGESWVLLLDQDTVLPHSYFEELARVCHEIVGDSAIAAIVPVVRVGERIMSPSRPRRGGRQQQFRELPKGAYRGRISAINSGALVRVGFVSELGGFDRRFWLDYLDHWLFHQIFRHHKCVYVLNSEVKHRLSISDLGSVSAERYANILRAESLFHKLFGSRLNYILYRLRLLARMVKHLRKDRRLLLITARHLLGR